MEKIGVEVAKPNDPNLTKVAAQGLNICTHPEEKVVRSKGVSYCRQCEKYLSVKHD